MGVRFPQELTEQIRKSRNLEVGDALGFRVLNDTEKVILIAVVPLKSRMSLAEREVKQDAE
jgi:hypothetical protein